MKKLFESNKNVAKPGGPDVKIIYRNTPNV